MAEAFHGFHQSQGDVRARELVESLIRGSDGFEGTDRAEVREAARLYPALQGLIEEHQLDALTVRCFDLLAELRTSGCLALAEMNDRGIIAGCEGDLVSTVAMLWTRELLGVVPWMANPADVDPELDVVRVAHCTVPRTLAARYRLRSHFESGIGVGLEGELHPGPVTLVRIGGAQMRRLWVADGESLPTSSVADACRTQLEVQVRREAAEDLLREPLGNHLVVVPGNHARRLRAWWEAMVCSTEASGSG